MSDGPSLSVLVPGRRKGYPVLGETCIWRHEKVVWDSCGLISNPHQRLADHSRSFDSSVKMRQFVLRYIQINLLTLVVHDYTLIVMT